MNITIPEEHDDTDADIAAAALTAADTKANGPRKPEWVCQHGLSHSLRSRAATDCQMSGCFNLASNIRSAAKMPRPTPVPRDAPHTVVGKPKLLATSRIAAVSPVQRRPLPSEIPADTRIRRLHLRKNAWWA